MIRAAVAAVVVLAFTITAHADAVRCRRAILKSSAKHAQAVAKVLQRCGDRVLAGRLPPSTDCTADPALAAADAKLDTGIARACCGDDGSCGTGDDEPLAAIGWDVGQCPDFESLGCTGAIATPADVGACLACLARAGGARLVELSLGHARPDATWLACERALGKEVARYARTASKVLARCWDARNRGAHQNPCPDPGDGEAVAALAQAAATLAARATSACAGATPADITSVEHCPAVTVPGGDTCTRPLATLADLVSCLGCVAAFETACVDRAAVPAFASYPPECNPPSPTCAAGVQCDTSLDCPSGYACADNGGGTRYCVGAACASDAECGGAGDCRPYCTTAGCDAPRCQCAGFGCTGPDELCLDDGGLACRKLCTQDSDCVDPFGFVCVNPGFGFGVCIGQVPCQ